MGNYFSVNSYLENLSLEEFSSRAEVFFRSKLWSSEEAGCALVRSGIVSTDVVQQTGLNLVLDVIGVDTLANNPGNVRVRGAEGICHKCIGMLEIDSLL